MSALDFDPFVANEGSRLSDVGHSIISYHIDFREPAHRSPITTLVKACEKRYAIELHRIIRVSKSDRFRQHGESLIRDPQEGRVSRTTYDRVDDPSDLVEARRLDNEVNRAITLAGGTARSETTSTRHTGSKSTSSTKNGWIFCAAIAPTNQHEVEQFRNSMDPAYDHMSEIHRPRAFALELASMVAEQHGPRGADHTAEGHFADIRWSISNKSQTVFHGPVVYVNDPYETISHIRTKLGAMGLLPAFVKSIEYKHQREYRFLVWAEEEPSEEVLDLEASLAMLGAMRDPIEVRAQPQCIDEPQPETEATETPGPETAGHLAPSILDLIDDPSFPVAPHLDADTDTGKNECVVTDAVIRALRLSVQRVPTSRIVQASSAAFHAEPLLRGLCQKFEAPVRSISVSPDNFVVIRIAVPDESATNASIVVGPHGRGARHMESARMRSTGKITVDPDFPLSAATITALEEAGVPVRKRLH